MTLTPGTRPYAQRFTVATLQNAVATDTGHKGLTPGVNWPTRSPMPGPLDFSLVVQAGSKVIQGAEIGVLEGKNEL